MNVAHSSSNNRISSPADIFHGDFKWQCSLCFIFALVVDTDCLREWCVAMFSHGAGGKKSSIVKGKAASWPGPPPSGVVQKLTRCRREFCAACVANA
jgi:hypothetical protein